MDSTNSGQLRVPSMGQGSPGQFSGGFGNYPNTQPNSSVQSNQKLGAQNPPPPPPPKELKTTDIKVEETGGGIKYFVATLAIAVIVGSLLIAYLQSARGSAASQAEAQYNENIGSVLESADFINQEDAVQTVGSQVAMLQASLVNRTLFSPFFTILDSATYKGTRLTRVVVNSESEVSIEGVTGSFTDLAKTMEAYQDVAKFKQVEMVAVEKQESGVVTFVAAVELDESIFSETDTSVEVAE